MIKKEKTKEESHRELVKAILENEPRYHLRYCIKVGGLISLGMTLANPNLKCWECPNNMCNTQEGICDPI